MKINIYDNNISSSFYIFIMILGEIYIIICIFSYNKICNIERIDILFENK